jgi:hypothetical protein
LSLYIGPLLINNLEMLLFVFFTNFTSTMKSFFKKLSTFIKNLFMATNAEILAKLDALDHAITAEKQKISDIIASQQATIATLTQQVADLQGQLSGVITAAEGDNIGSRVDTAAAAVQAIVP